MQANQKFNPTRRIPIHSDLKSKNHEVFSNAISQCSQGDPSSCIQNKKCMQEGDCFTYKPTQLEEADAIIHDLRASLEAARLRENKMITLLESKIIALGENYKRALKRKNEAKVWAYKFALQEFKELLKTLNPVDTQ